VLHDRKSSGIETYFLPQPYADLDEGFGPTVLKQKELSAGLKSTACDICCLGPFRSLDYLEFNHVAFVQRFIPLG